MADAEPARASSIATNEALYKQAVDSLVKRIDLRRWCVEQAEGDVVKARSIFDFCCEDVATIFERLHDAG